MKPVCTEKYNWYKWQEDCDLLDEDWSDYDYQSDDYEDLFIGDVLLLEKSKHPCQIVDINKTKPHTMRVKVLGLQRTRHRIITRWDIKKRDEFLTAVYKANAGTPA